MSVMDDMEQEMGSGGRSTGGLGLGVSVWVLGPGIRIRIVD